MFFIKIYYMFSFVRVIRLFKLKPGSPQQKMQVLNTPVNMDIEQWLTVKYNNMTRCEVLPYTYLLSLVRITNDTEKIVCF